MLTPRTSGHDFFHFTIDHRGVAVFDQRVILRHGHASERGLPDRILPHGDRGHFKHRRLLGFAVAAGILAIRPVGDAFAGNRHAFDDYFGKRRNFDIDGFAFDQLHRRAAQAAGDVKFVDAERHSRLRADDDRRIDADGGGDFQTFFLFLRHQNHPAEMMIRRRPER